MLDRCPDAEVPQVGNLAGLDPEVQFPPPTVPGLEMLLQRFLHPACGGSKEFLRIPCLRNDAESLMIFS
jgi:hypothetical protein